MQTFTENFYARVCLTFSIIQISLVRQVNVAIQISLVIIGVLTTVLTSRVRDNSNLTVKSYRVCRVNESLVNGDSAGKVV